MRYSQSRKEEKLGNAAAFSLALPTEVEFALLMMENDII